MSAPNVENLLNEAPNKPSRFHEPMIIVDGSSYLFRAYHALPPLTNSSGEPTGAIRGVLNMIQKLINTYSPQDMCVVFDTPGTNFRHEIFPEYKANRGAAPDDLVAQIEPIHQLIKACGIPLIAIQGVEADDVIATLALQASEQGRCVLISSGDKDLAQLVNDKVHLVNTMRDDYLDETGVFDKFQVRPDQIVAYLALIGDTSDNIPGITKVGPKTAAKWIAEFDTLDAIIQQADQVKGKVGENLRNQLEQLELSRSLVQLQYDVQLPVAINELQLQPAQVDKLHEIYSRFEFTKELKALHNKAQAGAATGTISPVNTLPENNQPQAQYIILHTEATVSAWLDKAKQAELMAFDTETTSLSVHDAQLVGISCAINAEEAVYIPCGHTLNELDGLEGLTSEQHFAKGQVSREFLIKAIKPLLAAETLLITGQNLKYDINVLKKYDIHINGIASDTMLADYVLNPTIGRHDMDSLAQRHLGRSTISFETVAGKGAKQITFDKVDISVAGEYAAEDAEITWLCHKAITEKLQQEPSLAEVLETIEMPCMPILAAMEFYGTLIDATELQRQSEILRQQIQALEQKAHDLVGEPFNMASPKQIGDILYTKMGLPVIKKTPKGAPSTAESVLQDLAKEFELPRLLLEHRTCAKLKSTYTDKLPELIHPTTGRIHTSYHQAVTATGRLSSSEPNLQNIPMKTEAGRQIRKAFIAPPEHHILAADYSQIELRIMAHLSKDERLCQAFQNNEDVHSATASEVFSVDLAEVNADQRRAAKAINFGLIYGMSAFGLASQLDISRADAQEYINTYFQRYPGVAQYMESTKAGAREVGYVETLFGRRLYLPDIKAKNHMVKQAAERTAINAPMQGTAADIVKIAMIKLNDWLIENNQASHVIMQVHDELVLEVPDTELTQVSQAVESILVTSAQLDVPLLVSIGTGKTWFDAH